MEKIIALHTDGNVGGYDTLQAAVNAAGSGDCVVVYPGHYVETVTLKDGVDINCIGTVLIDTVIDNGVTCACKISGSPTITTITLTGANSKITHDKLYKTFFALIDQSNTDAPVQSKVFANEIGVQPVYLYHAPGKYSATFTGRNFPDITKIVVIPYPVIAFGSFDPVGIAGDISNTDTASGKIGFTCVKLSDLSTVDNDLVSALLEIREYY